MESQDRQRRLASLDFCFRSNSERDEWQGNDYLILVSWTRNGQYRFRIPTWQNSK